MQAKILASEIESSRGRLVDFLAFVDTGGFLGERERFDIVFVFCTLLKYD
jgi:hypothetical protein